MKVDDPVNVVELTFVLDEVVAEARGLKKLFATPEADGAAGVERAVGRIKFDPISVQFSLPELNRNVAFGNRCLGFGVGVLAVSSNVQARRSWRKRL